MKTYCKRYDIDMRKIYDAYLDWAHHPSGRKNQWRVYEEYGSPDELCREIYLGIATRSIWFRPMEHYTRVEPGNGKVRDVTVESVKQQVCDYIVVRALDPMFKNRLGYHQLGGGVKSVEQLAKTAKRWSQKMRYFVHMDIRKCYQSTSTAMVMALLRKYIRSEDVLYLTEALLAQHGNGLALGSYLSLKLSQWILSFGYHCVENTHRVRRGVKYKMVKHQLWWADDVWLMGTSKRDVLMTAKLLEHVMKRRYGLEFKLWKICQIGCEPMDIAGRIVTKRSVTIRSSTFLRIDRSVRKFRKTRTREAARSLLCRKGILENTDSDYYIYTNGVYATMRQAQKLLRKDGTHARCTKQHRIGTGAYRLWANLAPQEHREGNRDLSEFGWRRGIPRYLPSGRSDYRGPINYKALRDREFRRSLEPVLG